MVDVDLVVNDGTDWWVQFVHTDANGTAVNVTAPKMEARTAAVSTAPLLYTSVGGSPTIVITQPAANIVKCSIAGVTTKNKTAAEAGYWDCYATEPDGSVVLLGRGGFSTVPNTTVL